MTTEGTFHSTLDSSVEGIKALILQQLRFGLARDPRTASKRDW